MSYARRRAVFRIGLRTLAVLSLGGLLSEPAAGEIKGYDEDLSDDQPAVVVDIDPVTGARAIPPEYAACPAAPNDPI